MTRTTSVREVVATLTGPRLEAVKRAHHDAIKVEALLRSVMADHQVALNHMSSILAAATGEEPGGLSFDPSTGSVYRATEPGK